MNVRARRLIADQQHAWHKVKGELAHAGLVVAEVETLNAADREWLDAFFMERIFPVLTPLAIDPAHPFPFIPNMGLVMALLLVSNHDRQVMRALIPLPSQVERFIRLPSEPGGPIRFVMLEEVVGLSLEHLFPGYSRATRRGCSGSSETPMSSSRMKPQTSCSRTKQR